MRGTHFYTSTADPEHPLHYMQTERQTRRHIHLTPAEHYRSLYNTLPPRPHNTTERSHIHTHFTARALASFPPNTLLNTAPPLIAEEERALSRTDRVHLSRLRCGHHPALQSYRHRIGLAEVDECNLCGEVPGDITHVLLNCRTLHDIRQQHDINTLEHLWTRPCDSMQFLHESGVL